MGTRLWLAALIAIAMACEVPEIGGPGTDDASRNGESGSGGTVGGSMGGGFAGSDGDGAGPDAGAGGAAGTVEGAGGEPGTMGNGGDGGEAAPCAGGPLANPIPNCRPTPPASTGDLHADCVARINQFRWECQCMPPLARWTDGESCADDNATYDSVNGVHASFSAMPCGTGARAQNECPGWPSTDHVINGCLQAMWDEGPEDGNPNTVNGHYESMATTTYTRVACGFHTTPSGEVWGVQNYD